MKPLRIAIIGAGIAGLACARQLQMAGVAVEVFDKARRVGGRLSSRRLALREGATLVDHGAQYFTARTPEFLECCTAALAAGAILPWPGRLDDQRAAALAGSADDVRYLGNPDMNALPRWLAQDLRVHCEAEVCGLRRVPAGWTLDFRASPSVGGFDALVVALPAEQTAVLLAAAAPALAAEAAAACTAPCWAGLFAFGELARWPDWWGLRPPSIQPLAWLARSRDGRGLIAHATPVWSRAHLESDPDAVMTALLEAIAALVPGLGQPEIATVHRWRYALVERAAGSAYGFDPALGVAVCGDWRLGPRVELAWTSGHTLGGALTGLLRCPPQA